MPTIPNFLHAQTPLGAAFQNLAGVLAAKPTDAALQNQADGVILNNRKVQGQQKLADFFRSTYAPQTTPEAPISAVPAQPVSAGPAPAVPAASPIAQAFGAMAPAAAAASGPAPAASMPAAPTAKPGPDWGNAIGSAIYADIDPKNLGGYNLFGAANQFGARDDRTTNATVGAGDPYSQTAQSFDITQAGENSRAAATDKTNAANNAANNATSRANNAASNAKDLQVEGLKEKQSASDSTTLSPQGIDYAADIYRRTGQLPALGMGKAAASARETIINRAQQLDANDGRTGADAVAAFADYQGQRAGQRTAGTREAQAGMAVNELTNLIPVAKHAFAGVARTGFVPADTLLQAYQNGTNDPALNAAAVAVNDVVNAHARAINPNGQVTDAGRAQGYSLLNTAKDQTAFNAILDQMAVGANAALKSPGQTRAQLHAAGSAPLAPHDGGVPAAPAAEEHWVRGPNGQLQRAQ